MPTEQEWTKLLASRINESLPFKMDGSWRARAVAAKRLAYANEIVMYRADEAKHHSPGYQTDILVFDENAQDEWIPRIVIECKVGSVTTHDALTYSTKAATHKHVHPYLRYGILVANFGNALPGRLIRHGAYFDFMMTWAGVEPTQNEWTCLSKLLNDELQASRDLQRLFSGKHGKNPKTFSVLHRKLRLEPYG